MEITEAKEEYGQISERVDGTAYCRVYFGKVTDASSGSHEVLNRIVVSVLSAAETVCGEKLYCGLVDGEELFGSSSHSKGHILILIDEKVVYAVAAAQNSLLRLKSIANAVSLIRDTLNCEQAQKCLDGVAGILRDHIRHSVEHKCEPVEVEGLLTSKLEALYNRYLSCVSAGFVHSLPTNQYVGEQCDLEGLVCGSASWVVSHEVAHHLYRCDGLKFEDRHRFVDGISRTNDEIVTEELNREHLEELWCDLMASKMVFESGLPEAWKRVMSQGVALMFAAIAVMGEVSLIVDPHSDSHPNPFLRVFYQRELLCRELEDLSIRLTSFEYGQLVLSDVLVNLLAGSFAKEGAGVCAFIKLFSENGFLIDD